MIRNLVARGLGGSLVWFLVFVSLLCCAPEKVSPQLHNKLDSIFADAENMGNLRSLIVVKDNVILKEKFYGSEKNTAHDVRSVTKSVMSTLIGIAIDKGFIQSADEPISNYLKTHQNLLDETKSKIKIVELLTMSSGIPGDELMNSDDFENWWSSADQVAYVLNQPTINAPGVQFSYFSGTAHITSIILTEATGMSTLQFAKQFLFQPMGIKEHAWERDKQGFYSGGAGISLTPEDMLKIGQLYLDKGVYNGVRVVSEAWIEKSTTVKINTNWGKLQPTYGYFWWINTVFQPGYFFAGGWGGQFIIVVPDKKLIVISTHNYKNVPLDKARKQWQHTLDLVTNEIIPLYE